MAIQIDDKKKKVKLPKSLDILFNFALALFLIVTASYFLISFLIANAEEVKKEIEYNIEKKKAEIPEREELEETARSYFNLIEDFKNVVEKQKLVSLVFEPLERITHPAIVINNVNINLVDNQAQISGIGKNLVVIGQQFHALKNNEFVSTVNLDALSVTEEEGAVFSFSIGFKEGLFDFYNIQEVEEIILEEEKEGETIEEEIVEEEELEINETEE